MSVYFYSHGQEPYGCFSNFSNHSFDLDGKNWKTSEHYFQAQKFVGTEYYGMVLKAKSPREAANMGRNRSFPLRNDWEQVKEDVMRKALEAKFTQNDSIKKILLSTDDKILIENSPNDYYWGCGSDQSGKNRLGVLLMELRDKLKQNN